jgi:hypothetical protein
MSPKEAIQAYIDALEYVGADVCDFQFKIENGRISLGYVFGPSVLDIQWGMQSHTPEEFAKMAKMRKLDLGHGGDPKRPTY